MTRYPCPICGVEMTREVIMQHVGSSRCEASRPPSGDVSKEHAPRIRVAIGLLERSLQDYYNACWRRNKGLDERES